MIYSCGEKSVFFFSFDWYKVKFVIIYSLADGAASEHRFSEYSFPSMQRCHLCDKFLYGLISQGLQCRGMSITITTLNHF